jgi:hypothetical protein
MAGWRMRDDGCMYALWVMDSDVCLYYEVERLLYPHDVRPCSMKEVMADHCSLRSFAIALFVCLFPWVDR